MARPTIKVKSSLIVISTSGDPVVTGYFGIPGRTGGKTHIVIRGWKKDYPICGIKLHPNSKFQWCMPWADASVECKGCKRRLTVAFKRVL